MARIKEEHTLHMLKPQIAVSHWEQADAISGGQEMSQAISQSMSEATGPTLSQTYNR